MKKFLRITGIFLLLVILGAAIIIIFYPKKIVALIVPELKQVNEVDIRLKGDMAYINTELTVRNTSFFTLAIDSIRYQVTLMNKEYLHNEKYLGLRLKPSEKDTIDFSLTLPFKEILHDLKEERSKGDSTDYSINVSLVYSTVFGPAILPYKKTARLKIPQPPPARAGQHKLQESTFKTFRS